MSQNNTKTKIIDLTIQEISQKSWQSFSLRPLLRQLGLTTGAFYKHFKDKDDLFKIVSKQLSHDIYQNIYTKIKTAPNSQEALLQLGWSLLTYFQEQPEVMDFLFFNPSVNYLYQSNTTEANDFELYNLTQQIIVQLVFNPHERDEFFIKIWSFIQGYGFLIKNKIVLPDRNLLKSTLKQFLGE
ncbi:TetR/AcrR family transcriptional regulator [Bombilactobacillus bombi]|uniref:TetR/AcrR family transcriptional regulator n=1 Tax=Bombilactobacillus bombi TaxID=1303590 RepID=UPI0015E61A56|nr:TetR/AcrR family transcriptional regulator [Bombilactobacillus bombi]MBA1434778.1 TetR/AcrR family transcriptional regulator [Bombilactobacillus bombi]